MMNPIFYVSVSTFFSKSRVSTIFSSNRNVLSKMYHFWFQSCALRYPGTLLPTFSWRKETRNLKKRNKNLRFL